MVNLSSDTQTLPSAGMRAAIANAEVGDEQSGNDPTVTRLCEIVAEMTGHHSALFLPSGTMANLVATASWAQPGDAVVVGGTSHSVESEAGSLAAVAGVIPVAIPGDGRFSSSDLDPFLEPGDRVRPSPAMVLMEQTVNFGGGLVWPHPIWKDVSNSAAIADVAIHVDGARIFNAVAATGVPLQTWVADAGSVYLDFTKGLGAPFGAVLAGGTDFIDEAWRWKHRLGGAMRQAGMMAAGCLYALEHNTNRLGQDHARAYRLYEALWELGCIAAAPETNMVWFEPPIGGPDVHAIKEAMSHHGVELGVLRGKIRAVTHLDIDDNALDDAIAAFQKVLG